MTATPATPAATESLLRDLTDRAELRDLVASYARAADRHDYELVRSAFVDDGVIRIHQPGETTPSVVLETAAGIAKAFRGLERYEVTTHFLGQHTVVIEGDRATGELYCLAHHLMPGPPRANYVMSIRYLDEYRRVDGRWRISVRNLHCDWTETRPMDG